MGAHLAAAALVPPHPRASGLSLLTKAVTSRRSSPRTTNARLQCGFKACNSLAKKSGRLKALPRSCKVRDIKTRFSPYYSKTPSRRPLCATFTRNLPLQKKLQVYVFGKGSLGELDLGPFNTTDVANPHINLYFARMVDIATGRMHKEALTSINKIPT